MIIDFTDSDVWSTGVTSADYDGLTVSLSSDPEGINFDDMVNNDTLFPCGTMLACDNDGIGIIDDEISNPDGVSQSVTVTFSDEVLLVGFAGFDLYADGPGEALIVNGTGMAYGGELSADGGNGWGYSGSLNLVGSSFTFTVDVNNDLAGVADGALAALDIVYEMAPVPLPAGILLLGGALGGLAMTRRRKAA